MGTAYDELMVKQNQVVELIGIEPMTSTMPL